MRSNADLCGKGGFLRRPPDGGRGNEGRLAGFAIDNAGDNVKIFHRLVLLEFFENCRVNHAEFDTFLQTGLKFATVVRLDRGEFLWTVDWFVVENSIEFKRQVDGGKVDVEFGVDRLLGIEKDFQVGIAFPQLFLQPDFKFRATDAVRLVEVVVDGGAGFGAENIVASGISAFAVCGYRKPFPGERFEALRTAQFNAILPEQFITLFRAEIVFSVLHSRIFDSGTQAFKILPTPVALEFDFCCHTLMRLD